MINMKICIIVSTFPPYKGGMGNSAYEFAKILGVENDVTVFMPSFCHSERSGATAKRSEESIIDSSSLSHPASQAKQVSVVPQNDNLKIERIKPTWKIGNGAVLLKLWGKLKDFDVIYLHYPFYGTAEIIWLYKVLHPRQKLAIHFHMDTPNLKWWGKILSMPSKLIKNNLMKRADKIISASLDYVAHSSIKEVWKKTPEKFIEIPFGVHLNKFHVFPHDVPDLKKLRAKYGIQEKDRVIMFLGGLDSAHRFKGIEVLLRAMTPPAPPLGKRGKPALNAKLLICGGGDLKSKYEDLAKELKIERQVIFAGRVPDEELVLHYNLADIFVLPSTDKSEAFGIVLLEAMACGVPVMASNLPGVRSVFKDGVQGYTVAPNSVRHLRAKLEDYLKHPQRRWKMGREARELVEKRYDWEKIADEFKEIFK